MGQLRACANEVLENSVMVNLRRCRLDSNYVFGIRIIMRFSEFIISYEVTFVFLEGSTKEQ